MALVNVLNNANIILTPHMLYINNANFLHEANTLLVTITASFKLFVWQAYSMFQYNSIHLHVITQLIINHYGTASQYSSCITPNIVIVITTLHQLRHAHNI